jgi:ribosomal protein L37AE/L43A
MQQQLTAVRKLQRFGNAYGSALCKYVEGVTDGMYDHHICRRYQLMHSAKTTCVCTTSDIKMQSVNLYLPPLLRAKYALLLH